MPPSVSTPTLDWASLFANLFKCDSSLSKYLNAPLLEERAAYITHLLRQGSSWGRVKMAASMQIQAIKLLNMQTARSIHTREVQEAGSRWSVDLAVHVHKRPGKATFYNFTHPVTQWLEFIGLLLPQGATTGPFEVPLARYLEELRTKGLSESTICLRRHQLSKFQMWLGEQSTRLREISIADIDGYLTERRTQGLSQRTLRNDGTIIRWFIRYCEAQGWCQRGLARSISIPRVIKAKRGSLGPAWKDVRRMLRAVGKSPAQLRAKAIICLCSIYALRNSEILHLRLNDLDWNYETMTVRRAKGGPVQQFPIQHEVGEAILAYLKSSRPRSICPFLFTTFRPPFRPMGPTCIQKTVAEVMRQLGIRSEKFGPHALRHACATQLLNRGFSLAEIAEFLGHRGLHSVSIYAKYNPRLLRRVASLSLAGFQ